MKNGLRLFGKDDFHLKEHGQNLMTYIVSVIKGINTKFAK